MRRAIEALQDYGIEVDIWKIEGVDRREDAEMLSEQTRKGEGRENVKSVLLGRGASDDKVDHWLREAAGVEGFIGFAIGRSIWWDALKGFLDDEPRARGRRRADRRQLPALHQGLRRGGVLREGLRPPVAARAIPDSIAAAATASATAGATARLKTLGTMYSGPRSDSGITRGDRARRGELHRLVDAARADVERAAEDAREREHVVDLVRVVRAARGHDRDVLPDRLGLDLGGRVGHREHDRVVAPSCARRRRENAPGAETPTTTSAPASASFAVPLRPRGFVRSAISRSSPVRSWRSGCRMPPMSQTTRSRTPCSRMIFAQASPAAPAPTITTRTSWASLADDPQRVQQRRQHHDRGAVLVVVEDGDVERLLQPPLDLEAARRRRCPRG